MAAGWTRREFHAGQWKAHGKTVLTSYDRRYVDVLSMNCYGHDFYGRAEGYYQHAKMPILNGECNCVGFVNWNKFVKGEKFTNAEKTRNTRMAVECLERAFTHPALVGYTWFKWYSGPGAEPAARLVTDDGKINQFNAPAADEDQPAVRGDRRRRRRADEGVTPGDRPAAAVEE